MWLRENEVNNNTTTNIIRRNNLSNYKIIYVCLSIRAQRFRLCHFNQLSSLKTIQPSQFKYPWNPLFIKD